MAAPHSKNTSSSASTGASPGNPKGDCASKGGEEVREAFKRLLHEKGLKGRIRANAAGCLDQCARGVTVVVYPEQVWYGGVRVEDVPGDRRAAPGRRRAGRSPAHEMTRPGHSAPRRARRAPGPSWRSSSGPRRVSPSAVAAQPAPRRRAAGRPRLRPGRASRCTPSSTARCPPTELGALPRAGQAAAGRRAGRLPRPGRKHFWSLELAVDRPRAGPAARHRDRGRGGAGCRRRCCRSPPSRRAAAPAPPPAPAHRRHRHRVGGDRAGPQERASRMPTSWRWTARPKRWRWPAATPSGSACRSTFRQGDLLAPLARTSRRST